MRCTGVHAGSSRVRSKQRLGLVYALRLMQHNKSTLLKEAGACNAGDGRHLLSNGKDQTAKLWDLRKMLSAAQHARLPATRVPNFEWDYRRAPPQPPCACSNGHQYGAAWWSQSAPRSTDTYVAC